jgi:pyrroloquinoline quinone biosynthesis protein D
MDIVTRLKPDDVVELDRNFHFRWEEPQRTHVLLYPEGIVKLNETAAAILARCVNGQSIAAVIHDLSMHYGRINLDRDVLKFLEVAHAKGWVRVKS